MFKNVNKFNIYETITKMPLPARGISFFVALFIFLSGFLFAVPVYYQLSLPILVKQESSAVKFLINFISVGFSATFIFLFLNMFQYFLVKDSLTLKEKNKCKTLKFAYLWTFSQSLYIAIFVIAWYFGGQLGMIKITSVLVLLSGVFRLSFLFQNISKKLVSSFPGAELLLCFDIWFISWTCIDNFF